MTYEQALYFKLLLLIGYQDELEEYIENALVEQNPITEPILSLATALRDSKQMLSALNEYLLDIDSRNIDCDGEVFGMIVAFFRKLYSNGGVPANELCELM